MKNVGIIGFGAIGHQIARSIDSSFLSLARLSFVLDSSLSRLEVAKSLVNEKPKTFSDSDLLFESESYKNTQIIVESASRAAVRDYAKRILIDGKYLIIFSVGELVDQKFLRDLESEAVKHSGVIHIPTGAIAGLDAIKSVRNNLEEVTISTTKNPRSLAGAPYFDIYKNMDLQELKESTILYEGEVSKAVELFPSNVNVFAALTLAIGNITKIKVRIIADPNIRVNRHQIDARGGFGSLQVITNNIPHAENPRTSELAIFSAVETVRSACNETLKIGS
ncbi:MAG TPA: aspartate dehydrogenase domain-containing protein [Nitrososphaeraceae archaeon]|nr:aspartate dehydrogenase domain-containing protein [Nitrososphaeraceae archaeon]